MISEDYKGKNMVRTKPVIVAGLTLSDYCDTGSV